MNDSADEKLFKEAFDLLFPDINLSLFKYGTPEKLNYSQLIFPSENKSLINSRYFYNGKNNLVHFTSLEALWSIIATKSLRLFNLHALNDPREFNYAAKVIGLSDDEMKEAKSDSYIISFCEKTLLNKRNGAHFNMWRLYGRDGNGCAIEFSFSENEPQNWSNYYLSPIIYGASERKKIKDLYDTLSKVNKKQLKIGIDLSQLLCLHKSLLYKQEQEVRLLFDYRTRKNIGTTIFKKDDKLTSPIIHTDIIRVHSQSPVRHLELPIYTTEFKKISGEIPIPKIEKITIGYRNRQNFEMIQSELFDFVIEKLGYDIKVELSNLHSIFW